MKRLTTIIVLFLILTVWIQAMRLEARPTQQELPGVEFLGQGPAEYDIGENRSFIVKRGSFTFESEPGPTYTAKGNERVWSTSVLNATPPRYWDEEVNLGQKPAGCVIEYRGIDDDPDNRINRFFLDGEVVETVTQGLVWEGSFTLPEAGNLTFYAEDSVGAWISDCVDILTPETPSATPTETFTPTPSETPTTGTPTVTTTPVTETPTPTETTFTPSPTPVTVTVTASPTKKPRLLSCVRINFDVSGHVARRGQYNVTELGGAVYATWYADDGWTDSGWFKDIDIVFEEIYVRVLFYSGPDRDPVDMKIMNPAPGTPYGWMARGLCHAIEVAWPDGYNPDGSPVQMSQAPQAPDSPVPSGEASSPPPPPPVVDETDEEEDSGSIYATLND